MFYSGDLQNPRLDKLLIPNPAFPSSFFPPPPLLRLPKISWNGWGKLPSLPHSAPQRFCLAAAQKFLKIVDFFFFPPREKSAKIPFKSGFGAWN